MFSVLFVFPAVTLQDALRRFCWPRGVPRRPLDTYRGPKPLKILAILGEARELLAKKEGRGVAARPITSPRATFYTQEQSRQHCVVAIC